MEQSSSSFTWIVLDETGQRAFYPTQQLPTISGADLLKRCICIEKKENASVENSNTCNMMMMMMMHTPIDRVLLINCVSGHGFLWKTNQCSWEKIDLKNIVNFSVSKVTLLRSL